MTKSVQALLTILKDQQRCIDGMQAKQEIQSDHGLLIDVREVSEHQAGAPMGAVNIPRGLLEFKLPTLEPDQNRAIYLHCAAGSRALFAAEQLKRIGYQRVTVVTCRADELCTMFAN
ncbi:rhodanese-like domain-containing protein [Pseudoalteromonas luteoviolacea]|uniref:rhodanese-like domain-containing protein n=1 Tax=Pseudoalteromonas luteoviolacea TaxID=43657 RepID=UPI001B3A3434|nr:rhodanese-like domain-containing protein [Pseudoalteromonas luteoviolacea]MBQ4879509.1 rhodanese-like domain-containing protein [Pseudoalteromonas luteoviolacea]MBQ4908564.1 rhodanese-like domain-containing protein [Pseudoalteromonas luteoviolacea]